MTAHRRTGARTFLRRAVVTAAVLIVVSSATVFAAGTGIRTEWWSGSGFNLSTTLHANSNATAFWQTILNSTGKCFALNGVFNTATRNATVSWQQDSSFDADQHWFPNAADGAVGADDFNAMQFAKSPGILGEANQYRHRYAGVTDGYGTQYWYFYGGGEPALLGWNPIAGQQFFDPYRRSHSEWRSNWTLIPASSNRTISTYACDA